MNNDHRADAITASDEAKAFPRLARYLAERAEISLEVAAGILVAAKVDTLRREA